MHIHGTNRIHGPHGINPPHISNRAAATQRSASANSADQVDISPAAEAAMSAEGSPIRHDLVNLIRRQIASGNYDTPEKMDIAMNRLLDELG
ncbi:MAG TPA: flagellar biosynthesis anti-sigma factor FlgM [Lacipirellulaceae bacterium]|nr:flagellar biosynthesis anti-sigma factor FlgM [Lacipirellulaceae bacterium]